MIVTLDVSLELCQYRERYSFRRVGMIVTLDVSLERFDLVNAEAAQYGWNDSYVGCIIRTIARQIPPGLLSVLLE